MNIVDKALTSVARRLAIRGTDPIARILFPKPRQRLAIQQQAVAVTLHDRAARIRDDEADAYRDQNAASAALYMALVAMLAMVAAMGLRVAGHV